MAIRLFCVFLSILGFVTCAHGCSVVFDLDGNPTNGPDELQTVVGTNVPVDIWIFGPPAGCIAWGTIMCNPDRSLVYVSCVYNVPTGWTGIVPQPPDPANCIVVQAVTFTGAPVLWFPARVATATWRAAVDHSIDTLVSAATSGVISSFEPTEFTNNEQVLATIRIGTTGTEATSWGSIKSMFR